MTPNFKALGLVLAAILALSAAIASTAEGLQVTAGEYPAILTSTQSAVKMVSVGSMTTACNLSATETDTIEEAVEGLTVIPSYESCTAHTTKPKTEYAVAITMTGCHYVRHGGTQSEANHFVEGTSDIICPEGVSGPMLEVWFEFSPPPCVYTIDAATNLTETTITNVGSDRFSIEWSMPTQLTRDGSLLCGAGEQSWTISGSETVRAYADNSGSEEEQIDVTVSE